MVHVIRKIQIETTTIFQNTLVREAQTKNTNNTKCWWGYKMAWPLGKTIWKFLIKLTYSLFDSSTIVIVVQSLGHVRLFVTPWTSACQASLFITNSLSLPKLMSIESVTPSIYFILCRPLLLPSSIFPSIRVFSNESVFRIRWPKYWSSASAPVLPMNIQD